MLQLDGNDLQQPWRSLYDANPLLLVQVHSPVQQVLNLSGLGLEELPGCMVLMRSLQELDISQNKIRVLPRLLSELPHLRAICLDNNPLEPHLAAILDKVLSESLHCMTFQEGTAPRNTIWELHDSQASEQWSGHQRRLDVICVF